MPEMTIFYVNQASQSYNNDIKIYYCNCYIIGQVIPALNSQADLTDYKVKPDEAKIIRPKYDVEPSKFLGLDETLGYFVVRGDKDECFLDYGYSKKTATFFIVPVREKFPIVFLEQHSIIIRSNIRVECF